MSFVTYTKKGIYCVPGNFYLDPWWPVNYAIISHAHADHARRGSKHYLCHNNSKNILKYRLGQDISISSLGFAETRYINGVTVSFYPAGHIVGSAQIRLEYKGYVVVFSGDYKLKKDFLTTPFEPVKCHLFITESTFGLPIYKWQAETDLQQQLHNWVINNQKNNKTSVFFGYSLGKAQRLLKLLENTTDIFVHNAIQQTNSALQDCNLNLPHTKLINLETKKAEVQNKIIVLPPALLGSKLFKKIPNAATAICSGWMHIRGNKRWKGVDAGFTVSDHADWQGLLTAIKATEAEKVYVTHGYQATLAKYLNSVGVFAQELSTQFGNEALEDISTTPEKSTLS